MGGSAAGVTLVAINTTLSAAAAGLAAAGITRIRYGRPDASLCANGWTGGLVASSAVCAFVSPASAAIAGATFCRLRWSAALSRSSGSTHGCELLDDLGGFDFGTWQ